jgi:hypothetical protein
MQVVQSCPTGDAILLARALALCGDAPWEGSEGTEGRQTGDETSHLTVGRSIAHYLPDNDWQILFLERKLEVCWGRELLLVVEEALVGRFEKFIH